MEEKLCSRAGSTPALPKWRHRDGRFARFMPRVLVRCLLPAVFFAGCQAAAVQPVAAVAPAAQASPAAPAAQNAAGATLARIHALAAVPACTADKQCHSLALGASPCGGPEAYLPWSSAHTPPDAIRALGKKYEAERREANAKSGRMSTCRFTPDPGAVCRAGVCELGVAGMQAR